MTAMDLQRIPWCGDHSPGENSIKRNLMTEGWDLKLWRDPSDRAYEAHAHPKDESLWVIRGAIVLQIDGRDFRLGPGDRLLLPKGTVHSAQAGPDGATYWIGQRD